MLIRCLLLALLLPASAGLACSDDSDGGARVVDAGLDADDDSGEDASSVDSGADLDDTAGEDASPDVEAYDPDARWEVAFEDGALIDTARERLLGYRIYFPEGLDGARPLILVSHGGTGSMGGHTTLEHLGATYASRGYVAIHIGHYPSEDVPQHHIDRPADVSFVLDTLEAGTFLMPSAFVGTVDLAKVGHVGFSAGAYTAHAVGGASFEQGNFRDPRILAICPISPQGAGRFGAYDRGPEDNSWWEIPVPVFDLMGSEELDGSVGGSVSAEGWRLQPFMRYTPGPDRYAVVVPGQNHGQMGNNGSEAVKTYIVENTLAFMDAYLRGFAARACEVGEIDAIEGIDLRRKFDPEVGLYRDCP